ncbi:cation transporter [Chitinimonas koreensis]|uniref:cation transporter n=1 Tax=Chitinimonas koreensis TaxID=356302 RepID=UPI0004005D9A|nr:cation transporter [Chitinimonas koreensis]QNM96627.1 hypothetical protein H9L41_23210 [Chitinimonas koreensis]
MSASPASSRSIPYALGAELAAAPAAFVAAACTGSVALLAVALQATAASAGLGLLQWSRHAADRSAAAARQAWAGVAAVLLYGMGGLAALYEGAHKLGQPEQMEAPWIALGALLFALPALAAALWRCLRERGEIAAEAGRRLWTWRLILGQLLASCAGLLLALAAVALAGVGENPLFDALGGLALGPLLIGTAIGCGAELASAARSERIEPRLREAIAAWLAGDPAVAGLERLVVMRIDGLLVVAAELRWRLAAAVERPQAALRIETALKAAFGQVDAVYLAGDVDEAATAAADAADTAPSR